MSACHCASPSGLGPSSSDHSGSLERLSFNSGLAPLELPGVCAHFTTACKVNVEHTRPHVQSKCKLGVESFLSLRDGSDFAARVRHKTIGAGQIWDPPNLGVATSEIGSIWERSNLEIAKYGIVKIHDWPYLGFAKLGIGQIWMFGYPN